MLTWTRQDENKDRSNSKRSEPSSADDLIGSKLINFSKNFYQSQRGIFARSSPVSWISISFEERFVHRFLLLVSINFLQFFITLNYYKITIIVVRLIPSRLPNPSIPFLLILFIFFRSWRTIFCQRKGNDK